MTDKEKQQKKLEREATKFLRENEPKKQHKKFRQSEKRGSSSFEYKGKGRKSYPKIGWIMK